MARVVIVGAGPAGSLLAIILAERGIHVELLERHAGPDREFRGERIVASGIAALRAAGLEDDLRSLPSLAITGTEVFIDGRRRFTIPFDHQRGEGISFLPQGPLLQHMWNRAAATGRCTVRTSTVARTLLRDDLGRVNGVNISTGEATVELPADLVIGCDGRTSTVRRNTDLDDHRTPDYETLDIVWVRAPAPPALVGSTTARMYRSAGSTIGVIPAPDGTVQYGWIIPKGSFGTLRGGGTDDWIAQLESHLSSDIAGHLGTCPDRTHALLDITCYRLHSWSQPGVLLLGDAAHPMSPAAGQGISLALRDSIVAANHLVPVLSSAFTADDIDTACLRVHRERETEIVAIQDIQRKVADRQRRQSTMARVAERTLLPMLARRAPHAIGRLVGGRPETYHGVTRVELQV